MAADAPWFVQEVPTIFISMANPYHLIDVPMIKTYINCYSNNDACLVALVNKINWKGRIFRSESSRCILWKVGYKKMIEAIIFDLDGVICSTDQYHYKAWKELADELDIPFDEKDNEKLRGVSRMESLDIILEKSSKKYLK